MATDYAALDATIGALGLTYSAEFVPFSKSRNAKSKARCNDMSLNWKVTVSKGSRALTTDYMQGIAHIPGYKQLLGAYHGYTLDEEQVVIQACEYGKVMPLRAPSPWLKLKPVPAPLFRDVLHSLVLDSSVLDSGTFEEWASEYGYDTDSRKAESIYKSCMEIALLLRSMVGDSGIETLRAAFQDY